MNLIVRKNSINDRFYIVPAEQECPGKYLHHNLKLYCYAGSQGHWKSLIEANRALRQYYKEKHNMAEDNLVISVKLNDIVTPLHEISEETLLKIREASKPKLVPAFQVCETPFGDKRLVLKVTGKMAKYSGKYICLDEDGAVASNNIDVKKISQGRDGFYNNIHELKLDEV